MTDFVNLVEMLKNGEIDKIPPVEIPEESWVLDDVPEIGSDGKKFRIQNSTLHLTYRSHINIQEWLDFVQNPKNQGGLEKVITEYSIVHEVSEKNGYYHTHILVRFGKLFQSISPRVFDFQGIHPNIKKVLTDLHWNRTVEYHKKQGNPIVKLATEKPPLVEKIWGHEKVSDALIHICKTTRDVGGVIAAFKHKPIDYGEEPKKEWRPWQLDILKEVEGTPDDRVINWIWDPYGNSGKSLLAKHMGMYKGAFVTATGNIYDVATQLQEAMKDGNSYLTMIFNFSRQNETHKVYQALECLKDGMVTSRKYKGQTMYFDNPHVYVFANCFPDLTKISLDRWYVRTITGGMHFKHKWTGAELEGWIQNVMRTYGSKREDVVAYLAKLTMADLEAPPGTKAIGNGVPASPISPYD